MPHARYVDEFTWDGNRKILTPNELRVPAGRIRLLYL